jgi:hypothetical protein
LPGIPAATADFAIREKVNEIFIPGCSDFEFYRENERVGVIWNWPALFARRTSVIGLESLGLEKWAGLNHVIDENLIC